LHLKITEWVASGASVVIKLHERHGTSGNDGDDGVGAFLTFACDSNLIASRADAVDSALVLLFQGTAKGVGALVLQELRKVLDLYIGGVLRNAKIKLGEFAADTSTGAYSHTRVSLGGYHFLGEYP